MGDAPVRKIQVMVSSTRADLLQYRKEATLVIKRVAADVEKRIQLLDVSMEKETQSGDREFAVAVSKRWVEESDWIVVIVAWNYGTVSDEEGAAGLSVTEWEYRHAVKLRKKTFVFVAGDPVKAKADEYRVSSEETEDLKDWNLPDRQSEDQKAKLKKFKEELESSHVQMFAHLANFRERLEKTLRNAIEDLPPDVQPGSALAELVLSLTPAIRACARQVNLIADCKQIHDWLHELRQKVIRRLREEVLPRWSEEGTLSRSNERLINSLLNKASTRLGAVGQMKHSIASDQYLLRSLDGLLNLPPLWDVEVEPPPSIERFSENVDDFAARVRQAFRQADRSMATEERAFDDLHTNLLNGLSDARQKRYLNPTDDQKLAEEISKVGANKSRLVAALTSHHAWQGAHDTLENLGEFRETDRFDTSLRRFCQNDLPSLLDLVDRELSTAAIEAPGDAGRETAGAGARSADAPSAPESQTANSRTSDLQHLREHLEALKRIGDLPRDGARGKGGPDYDSMRVLFDDAFYRIDKRTLEDVLRSRERVSGVERLLEVLATGFHQTA